MPREVSKVFYRGKHYNRSWKILVCFAKAIGRLSCKTLVPHCAEELEALIKEIMTEVDCRGYQRARSGCMRST